MITLGVDLAAQEKDTAACRVLWANREARVEEIICGVDDRRLVKLLAQCHRAGIDVPFGWPDAFVDAVSAYEKGRPWPDAKKKKLLLRETDRFVLRRARLRPLSVSSDRIAIPAMRAAKLFTRLAKRGEPVDRSGSGKIVEVYPAAALKIWGFTHESYKDKKGYEVRSRLIADFEKATKGWLEISGEDITKFQQNDDALDALIAALVARAAAVRLCEQIPRDSESFVQREGWIALPKPGTLGLLPREP